MKLLLDDPGKTAKKWVKLAFVSDFIIGLNVSRFVAFIGALVSNFIVRPQLFAGMTDGGRRSTIKNLLVCVIGAYALGTSQFSIAMRTLPFDEYATFKSSVSVEKGDLKCIAPIGTVVRILGESTAMGTDRQPNLHDYATVRKIGNIHPSDLEHNSALSYDGGEYGSSWTPNLALARILLAAYLLASIQTIQGRVISAPGVDLQSEGGAVATGHLPNDGRALVATN